MTRVNGRWSQQGEAPMAMLLVVPGEELAAERQAVVVGRKPLRDGDLDRNTYLWNLEDDRGASSGSSFMGALCR